MGRKNQKPRFLGRALSLIAIGAMGTFASQAFSFSNLPEDSSVTRKFECQGIFLNEGSLAPRSRVQLEGEWVINDDKALSVVQLRLETRLAELGGDYADDLVFEHSGSASVSIENGLRLQYEFFRAPLQETGSQGFTGFYLRLPAEEFLWVEPGTEFDSDLDFYSEGDSFDHAPLACEVVE